MPNKHTSKFITLKSRKKFWNVINSKNNSVIKKILSVSVLEYRIELVSTVDTNSNTAPTISFIFSNFYDRNQIIITGNALGIWICGCRCSLFSGFSKSVSAHSTRSGCKRWCLKELRVCAPAAPVLTHSLH